MKDIDILYITRLTPESIRALRRELARTRRNVKALNCALGILLFVVLHQAERIAYLENKDETAG